MDDTPGYTEEPFACPGCGAQIGALVWQYGRVVGMRVQMRAADGAPAHLLVRYLTAACEYCGETVIFSVSDAVLRQVLLELQAARILSKPAQA